MPPLPVAAATSANHLASLSCRPAAGASTSRPMPTRPAGTASSVSAAAPERLAFSASCCARSSATSTMICAVSAPTVSLPRFASSSSRTTPASSCRRDERCRRAREAVAAAAPAKGRQACLVSGREAAPAACLEATPATNRPRPQRRQAAVLRSAAACGAAGAGAWRGAPPGRDRRGHNRRRPAMIFDLPFDDAYEPHHAASPTDRVILELQMYGHRPHQDEPDPRPLPDETVIRAGLAGIFETIAGMLGDTRLEPDLDDLLWSAVNVFHRAAERVERELDRNEDAQRASQGEQDGSEVKSVELERLTAEGITLVERRNAFEVMRDEAADLFEAHTGSAWRPRTGSQAQSSGDDRFGDRLPRFPRRPPPRRDRGAAAGRHKIAFTGGIDFNDHERIWATLDRAREKHPDMVLLHGGSPRGAERIAACWAENRKVTQIAFKPDWNRHGKAAPFRRNDQMLSVMPAGVIVFPGSGITENLADKARRLGIPVWRFTGDGA